MLAIKLPMVGFIGFPFRNAHNPILPKSCGRAKCLGKASNEGKNHYPGFSAQECHCAYEGPGKRRPYSGVEGAMLEDEKRHALSISKLVPKNALDTGSTMSGYLHC